MKILDRIKGIADSDHSGAVGEVSKMFGLDIHSKPGVTRVAQKLTKDSGVTVTELVTSQITDPVTSDSFHFSGNSGKVWKRTNAGVWSLAHTTTPASGETKCLDAFIHQGYIYWATSEKLHRILLTGLADWATNAEEDFATFTNGNTSHHPMATFDLTLWIGDGNELAFVNNSNIFNSTSNYDVDEAEVITVVEADRNFLRIASYFGAKINKSWLRTWDGTSVSWLSEDMVPVNGINAFLKDEEGNFLLAQGGDFGKWYLMNGEALSPILRLPGVWTPTTTGKVYKNAVGFLNVPVFGFSNITGNPTEQGVYSYGSYSRDYEKTIDLTYPISERDTGDSVYDDIQIGSILVQGMDMFVSWKRGTKYGVDKLDYTAKFENAYFETMVLEELGDRGDIKDVGDFYATYSSLPTDCAFVFGYKLNNSDTYTFPGTEVNDTELQAYKMDYKLASVANMKVRVDFTVKVNTAPEMETFGINQIN